MRTRLDGYDLLVDGGTGWALTWGPAPYIRSFEVPVEVAERLVAERKIHGSKLVFDAEGLQSVEISGLTILRQMGGSRSELRRVVVADRRWAWAYQFVRLVSNVRTRTGYKTRFGAGPLQVRPLTDDEAFRAWSVDPGGPRTALAMLTRVLDRLEPGNYEIETSDNDAVSTALEDNPENARIIDRGDAAVARALGLCGGVLGIYVTEAGKVKVEPITIDTASELMSLEPDLYDLPVAAVMDRSLERPAAYRFVFERRLELRADYAGDDDDGDFGDDTTQTRGAAPDVPLDLTWVCQVTDTELEVGGRTVSAGVVVPGVKLLEAKEGDWAKFPADLPDLSANDIRTGYLEPSMLSSWADPMVDDNGDNARCIAALRNTYRTFFQLRRALRERLVDIRPELTSVVDVKSGTRAEAPVYADHARIVSVKELRQERERGTTNDALVRNVFADRGSGGAIADIPPERLGRAPATVSVIDEDLGLFRVDYDAGDDVEVAPSAVEADGLASGNVTDDNLLLQWSVLRSRHNLAFIFSAQLASSTDDVLFSVVIASGPIAGGQACLGPTKVVYVPPTALAANFGWQQEKKSQIRGVLGGSLGASALDELLLNREDLEAYALAGARADLHSLLDRPDGNKATALYPVAPRGGAAVAHYMDRDGATTTVAFPGAGAPSPPLEAMLPDALRKMIGMEL